MYLCGVVGVGESVHISAQFVQPNQVISQAVGELLVDRSLCVGVKERDRSENSGYVKKKVMTRLVLLSKI